MQKSTRHTTRNISAALALSAVPLFAFANNTPPPAPHHCGDFNASAAQGAPQHQPDSQYMGMPFPPPPLASLDLSESQQRQIFELRHAQAPAIFETEQIVRNTMRELQQLAKADRFDAGKAKSLAEAHGKTIAELIYLHTETQSKIWTLLTDAQRKQLTEQQEQPPHPHR